MTTPPDDTTAPVTAEGGCRHEFCRYAEQIAERFPMTDPGNIDKIIDAAAHTRSLPIIGEAHRRVAAAETESAQLRARVEELTALLNDHDRG